MKKKNIDTTSIVMTAVFAVLVIGAVAGLLAASVNRSKKAENGNVVEEENGIYETDITVDNDNAVNTEIETQTEETVKYETYEELADKFVELCEVGDTESMYSLYYDDLLTKKQEISGQTKEDYDFMMKENMLHITGFEEYRYGEGELIMDSPTGYVNQIFFRANGEAFPYTDVVIDDCVDLRAYFSNGAYLDFMLAKIDGYWYMVV